MQKLLLVVDYQNDFVTGSLGSCHTAAIEPKILQKIKAYRNRQDVIAFTMDTHDNNYSNTSEGQHLPIEHCIKGEDGWRLTDAVEALRQPEDLVFLKDRFGSTALFDHLRQTPYAEIELIGVVTNICVLSNAVLAKTACPETPISVSATATASNDPILHQKALDLMECIQITVRKDD